MYEYMHFLIYIKTVKMSSGVLLFYTPNITLQSFSYSLTNRVVSYSVHKKLHLGLWIQLASICSQSYIFIFSTVLKGGRGGPCSQLLTVHFYLTSQTELFTFSTNERLLHSHCSSKCASERSRIYS